MADRKEESRKEELEKKRKRLAELRKQTEERKKDLISQNLTPQGAPQPTSLRKEVDELVQILVGESVTEEKEGKETLHEVSSPTSGKDEVESAPERIETKTLESKGSISLANKILSVFEVPPKEIVYYHKEVQTDTIEPDDQELETPSIAITPEEVEEEEEEEEEEEDQPEEAKEIEYTEEEKKQLFRRAEFQDFLDRSSKYIERALNQPYDYLVDYAESQDQTSEANDSLKLGAKFYFENYCDKRVVTDIDWSLLKEELLAASYAPINKDAIGANNPEGLVLIWNLNLPSRPEYVFHSPSPVLSTRLSPYNSHILVGGTYTGQILIWDLRTKTNPVLKTSLSTSGHTQPICKLDIIGTSNAHNIASLSSDGIFCTWGLDTLSKPQENIDLSSKTPKTTPRQTKDPKTEDKNEIAMSFTTMSFKDKETSTFLVGAEDGTISQAVRSGSEKGIIRSDNSQFKGHAGPITGLHFHPPSGSPSFLNLFLTSSVDWSVKLWSNQKPGSEPLKSFEAFSDYVLDVAWSPKHPSLFSTVDASGKFSLWNLNSSSDFPIKTLEVSQKGLNKARWDKEGRHSAIGSTDGSISICDIGELAQEEIGSGKFENLLKGWERDLEGSYPAV